MSIGILVHGIKRIELEPAPKHSLYGEGAWHQSRTVCQRPFPSQGTGWVRHTAFRTVGQKCSKSQAGVLQYHSFGLFLADGGVRWRQGGSGEGALPEPPAWEVPPKALCSCKADCNSLESFFYPLLNSLSLSDNLF